LSVENHIFVLKKNMNRIDRLMGIITQLQTKKHLTVPQIAEQFRISERTVFRDLRAIGEIGVPVSFEPDKGYSVGNGYFLPPVSLTVEEANALSLAEPLVVRFSDKSIHQHYGSALSKIKMVLGRAQREKMEITQAAALHFVPDKYANLMPSTDYLTPLQSAIINQNIIKIDYLNQNDFQSERELEPIGLTFYSLNWHLIAWCHTKNAYRDFRTNRIQNLKVTMQPFRKKDHIGLNDYLQNMQKEILENREHPLT
jgi:predicted DNA-binding transcriptional regulator YafY